MSEPQDRVAELIRAAGHRPGPSAEAYERLRSAAHAQWQAGLRVRRRSRLLALAAGIAVLGLGALLYPVLESRRAPQIVARLTQTGEHQILRARAGESALDSDLIGVGDELRTPEARGITLAQLPNGTTSLRLAANSRLRWKSADRVELLAGAVYVDTSHGSSGPGALQSASNALVIEVGDARIDHIGTQFMAMRHDREVEVLVRDGLVRVTLGRESRRLVRGETAILSTQGEGPIQTRRRAATDQAWEWADALAPGQPIEGRDLLTVLRTLAYQGGLELRFASPSLQAAASSTTLHGPALNLPPREAMRALLASSGLRMAENPGDGPDWVLIEAR